jgi:hypothetical protein
LFGFGKPRDVGQHYWMKVLMCGWQCGNGCGCGCWYGNGCGCCECGYCGWCNVQLLRREIILKFHKLYKIRLLCHHYTIYPPL